MCDQRLVPFDVIKFGLKVYKLNTIVDATSFVCNCDLPSKSTSDNNELQRITYLML